MEIIALGIIYLIYRYIKYLRERRDNEPEDYDGIMEEETICAVALSNMNESTEQENKQQNIMETTNDNHEMEQPDTLGLIKQTLKNMGCQPEIDEEENVIVKYQGETFQMIVGGVFVLVWDTFWFSVQSDHSDMPIIREAINDTNFSFGPTLVISAPDKEGNVHIHSRRDFLFHPAIPDITDYLQSMLNSFFEVKQRFQDNLRKLKIDQEQGTRLSNGFTLYDQN